ILPMQALESIRKLAPDWVRYELAHVSPLSDSGLETIARLLFHRVRVPVRAQVLIEGVRHVDLLTDEWDDTHRRLLELVQRGLHRWGRVARELPAFEASELEPLSSHSS
ncbi:MAG: hypothetical protein K0S05_1592, partial [Agromyces sp.]|nr:hypothetical protein [Agromyces sp.]